MKRFKWNELTPDEQKMAENQLLSMYEDWAADGDDVDNQIYQEMLNDKEVRIDKLKHCTFTRWKCGEEICINVWL